MNIYFYNIIFLLAEALYKSFTYVYVSKQLLGIIVYVSIVIFEKVWWKHTFYEILSLLCSHTYCFTIFILSEEIFNSLRKVVWFFQLEECLIKVDLEKRWKKPNFHIFLRLWCVLSIHLHSCRSNFWTFQKCFRFFLSHKVDFSSGCIQ